MQFSIVSFLTAFAITGLALAAPTNNQGKVQPPARYYLQTKVVNGDHKDTGSIKNGLWVYSYHTGAGLGDAGLSSNRSYAMEAYLQDGQQLFTYQGSIGPWPLVVEYGPYQAWNLATISIAGNRPSGQGFYFNKKGLQFNQTSGGWLACDWWHSAPQLFNLNGYYKAVVIPSSCSKVELYPIAI